MLAGMPADPPTDPAAPASVPVTGFAAAPMIPVLGGPTASGKSALALGLAEPLGLEIVSADAMMVYRGLDVGTAKPTPDERLRVPHHLIDVAEPDETFSVARYVRLAEGAIAETLERGRLPVVVGGTGFYIRALTEGLPTAPAADPEAQRPLWERLERAGLDALEAALYALSPDDARRAQRNPRRLVRALEIWERTGRSPTSFPLAPPRFRYSKRRLEPGREELAERIEGRTAEMFAAGLVAEVRGLLARFPASTTAFQAIGYKEVRAALAGEYPLTDAPEAVARATRRYARRQETWFRREPGMARLEPSDAALWLASLRPHRDLAP